MNRVVRGSDGRMWNVRTNLEWSNPIDVDEWEHDVSGGAAPGMAMGAVLLFLFVGFVVWTPPSVYVPPWLVLALAVIVLFFPVRWLLRRPWTVMAETPGDEDERPPERWVGVVRGFLTARQRGARVARDIEVYSEPDMNGPLQPIA
ncbi:DUF1656 domain-containing protein [Haloactinomyces albus]|uniref:DUF983 domain-containing protein n=1 Tax=Haloactinomyces albus TaxID=1352928 RepID=A0AAE3ZET0_9ACTN|nr:DUF1656 domain-containing protein [Haloactinomyces albus]MDR7301927.1 hypothetical protein [Haloactinomyces albus]